MKHECMTSPLLFFRNMIPPNDIHFISFCFLSTYQTNDFCNNLAVDYFLNVVTVCNLTEAKPLKVVNGYPSLLPRSRQQLCSKFERPKSRSEKKNFIKKFYSLTSNVSHNIPLTMEQTFALNLAQLCIV